MDMANNCICHIQWVLHRKVKTIKVNKIKLNYMSGFMKMVLKNSTPVTLISPYFTKPLGHE